MVRKGRRYSVALAGSVLAQQGRLPQHCVKFASQLTGMQMLVLIDCLGVSDCWLTGFKLPADRGTALCGP